MGEDIPGSPTVESFVEPFAALVLVRFDIFAGLCTVRGDLVLGDWVGVPGILGRGVGRMNVTTVLAQPWFSRP